MASTGGTGAPAPGPTMSADRVRLKHVIVELLEQDERSWADNVITKALEYDGVTNFTDFVSLTESDIMHLVIPADRSAGTTERPLHRGYQRKLVQVLAFFHAWSREYKKAIVITRIGKDQYMGWVPKDTTRTSKSSRGRSQSHQRTDLQLNRTLHHGRNP